MNEHVHLSKWNKELRIIFSYIRIKYKFPKENDITRPYLKRVNVSILKKIEAL